MSNTCKIFDFYDIILRMKQETAHPHNGHRKRLRTLINKVGLENLSDIQIMEQILTMSHSRCDTNEIAHRLLDKFGSISQILDADINDLVNVEGVGEVTAAMLTYLPQIFEIYSKDKNKKKYSCKTNGDVYNYFNNIFKNYSSEILVIAYINRDSSFESYEILAHGDTTEVKIEKLELLKTIAKCKAKGVILAHNHPFGSAMPSYSDYDAYAVMTTHLTSMGINLIDSVIIGDDGMFSFKNSQHIKL